MRISLAQLYPLIGDLKGNTQKIISASTTSTQNRANLLRDMDEYAGKYYSRQFVRNRILRQSEEEQKELDAQMSQEQNDPKYNQTDDQGGGFGGSNF